MKNITFKSLFLIFTVLNALMFIIGMYYAYDHASAGYVVLFFVASLFIFMAVEFMLAVLAEWLTKGRSSSL